MLFIPERTDVLSGPSQAQIHTYSNLFLPPTHRDWSQHTLPLVLAPNKDREPTNALGM